MAITSLQNLTVKTTDANSTLLMPKLSYRFRVTLIGFAASVSTELTKQVISCSRHSVKFDQITLDVYNSKVYLAGKPVFEPIKLVIRDDAGGNIQTLVGQQIQKQYDVHEQASARSGVDYKFTMQVELLDGGNGVFEPQVLETNTYAGCYIESANYGSLEYKTSDAVSVELSVRFDTMEQWASGASAISLTGGIGANVGRATASNSSSGLGNSSTLS